MSESSGTKKFEPLEHARQRLRRQGDVAQSQDLAGAASLLAALAVLAITAEAGAGLLADLCRRCLTTASEPTLTASSLISALTDGAGVALSVCTGVFAAAAGVGAFACVAQTGPIFSLDPLSPRLNRLSPLANLKSKLASTEAAVTFLRTILKLVVVGAVCWLVLRDEFPRLVTLSRLPFADAVRTVSQTLVRLSLWPAVAFVALGVADLLFQRWNWLQKHMLSFQQFKEQLKEVEPNPQAAAGRRRLQAELAYQRSMAQVPTADWIVANPTHLACAMRYDPAREGVPRLIAKGRGLRAQEIFAVARRNGIPIIRRKDLARSLFQLRLNQQIPRHLFAAVLGLMDWIEEQSRASGREVAWRRPRASRR